MSAPSPSGVRVAVRQPGAEVRAYAHSGVDELWGWFCPLAGEPLAELLVRVTDSMPGASLLQLDLYGAAEALPELVTLARSRLPATIVTGIADKACEAGLSQLQVQAVKGIAPTAHEVDGRIVAAVYQLPDRRVAVLGGLLPESPNTAAVQQAHQTFELLETTLDDLGLALSDLLRTWVYVDRILDWYGALNQVRNGLYSTRGLFDRMLPASTGIGAANHAGTALMLSAWAQRLHSGAAAAVEVASPRQNAPRSYGSAFARAVEIQYGAQRKLTVSGTASVDANGHSIHPSHASAQMEHTIGVIDALLSSRGYGWGQVCRAVLYVKNRQDAAQVGAVLSRHGLALPTLQLGADICRPDLLVELEVDAVK